MPASLLPSSLVCFRLLEGRGRETSFTMGLYIVDTAWMTWNNFWKNTSFVGASNAGRAKSKKDSPPA